MYEDIEIEETGVTRMQSALGRKWQHYLDLSAPHTTQRWVFSTVIMLIYCLRVYLINGCHRTAAASRRLQG